MGPVKFAKRDWTHAQPLAASMGKPHNFTGGVDYPALSSFFFHPLKRRSASQLARIAVTCARWNYAMAGAFTAAIAGEQRST